jgi:hypothetical protein
MFMELRLDLVISLFVNNIDNLQHMARQSVLQALAPTRSSSAVGRVTQRDILAVTAPVTLSMLLRTHCVYGNRRKGACSAVVRSQPMMVFCDGVTLSTTLDVRTTATATLCLFALTTFQLSQIPLPSGAFCGEQ